MPGVAQGRSSKAAVMTFPGAFTVGSGSFVSSKSQNVAAKNLEKISLAFCSEAYAPFMHIAEGRIHPIFSKHDQLTKDGY